MDVWPGVLHPDTVPGFPARQGIDHRDRAGEKGQGDRFAGGVHRSDPVCIYQYEYLAGNLFPGGADVADPRYADREDVGEIELFEGGFTSTASF